VCLRPHPQLRDVCVRVSTPSPSVKRCVCVCVRPHHQLRDVCVYVCLRLHYHLSIYLPTHSSSYVFIYLSTHLPAHPSSYVFIYLSTHPSAHPSIYLPTYLSIHLPVYFICSKISVIISLKYVMYWFFVVN
jgi:hypothetical protein